MSTRRKGGQRRGFANAEKALTKAREARRERYNKVIGAVASMQGSYGGPITPERTGPKTNTQAGITQFLHTRNLGSLAQVNRGLRSIVKNSFHFQQFVLQPGQRLADLYGSFPGALNIDLSQKPYIQDKELLEAIPLGFKNVRTLNMAKCRQITDAGLAPLTNLTSLNMARDQITDAGLAPLTNLTSLNIALCREITDTGLARLTNLTSLNIYGCQQITITDAGLAPLIKLTSLDMGYCDQITDAGLATLTNLTSLNMDFCSRITDTGLAPLTNLTSLSMRSCERITDAGLAPLTNLTSLNIAGCIEITDEGLAHLTKLTSLNIDGCDQITDAGLAPLTNLTSLSIYRCKRITAGAFTNLNKLEYCNATFSAPGVEEAAKAKIAENKARKSVSNMEALDGGTRRRRSKKSKKTKKMRRIK